IRGTMPPGVVVPLHCHAEPELLYVLEGSFEAFKSNQRMKGWTTASEGDLVIIPGNVKHALRNNSSGPVILALVTNAHLYRVFRALARPLNPDQHPTPPNTGSDAGALCDRGTVRILDSVAGEECRDRCESGVAMPAG